jgi:hypothetical protein
MRGLGALGFHLIGEAVFSILSLENKPPLFTSLKLISTSLIVRPAFIFLTLMFVVYNFHTTHKSLVG